MSDRPEHYRPIPADAWAEVAHRASGESAGDEEGKRY